MKVRDSILGMAVALLLSAPVLADTGRVSLQEAVTLALARNHLLKAAAFDQQAAGAKAAASRSRYLPRVFLEESAVVSNLPTRVFMMKLDEGRFTKDDFEIANLNHPNTHGDFRTMVALEQPLFDLGIGYGAELADREEAVRRHTLEQRRDDVALRVVEAYLEVHKAAINIDTAEKAVRAAREHLRLATVRGTEGVGLKSDELRARTFLAEMEQQSISARNSLLLAKMRLAQVTGAEAGSQLDIAGGGESLSLPLGRDDLVKLALGSRPELRGLEQEAERAEVEVKMARSAYFPTVYAGASYQMNDRDIPFGRDNDGWLAGATLRWELFDGLRRGKEAARARAMRQSAAEALEEHRQQVVLQVHESCMRREEAEKRLEVARDTVADAEEMVRLIGRRFDNSLATMVELLDGQTSLNRARALVADNENNYALATARVYHAAGVLTKEVLK